MSIRSNQRTVSKEVCTVPSWEKTDAWPRFKPSTSLEFSIGTSYSTSWTVTTRKLGSPSKSHQRNSSIRKSWNDNKLPNHWNSKVPKTYKRNAINADLFRSKRIASEMEKEITIVKEKFTRAGFPVRFTDSVICQFDEKSCEVRDDEMLIPQDFFEEKKKKLFIELTFCLKNEELSKTFLKKFHTFTKNSFSHHLEMEN